MKNVLLVFIGFVVGTVSVFLFITHGVEKQLGKNEPVEIDSFSVETKTEVKYLLGEKKECKDKGGEFYVIRNTFSAWSTSTEEYDYRLSCDKYYTEGNKRITETIFDYEI